MKPKIGDVVYYFPTKVERELMNNNQDKCPAVITAVWGDTCVNLKVIFDGIHDIWKTSISKFGTYGDSKEFVWDFIATVESN